MKFLLPVVVSGIFFSLSAAEVLINMPMPWMTLRNDSIMVRVQADTSGLPRNQIAFNVRQNGAGGRRQLISKTVTLEEYSGEFFLGSVKKSELGGSDWLSLEWSVPGTDKSGHIGPLGIADLEKLDNQRILNATRFSDDITLEKAVAEIDEGSFTSAGNVGVAMGWNKNALYIVYNPGEAKRGELYLAIDGKCGKNAFLSWSDRFIVFNAESDSLWGIHYRRSFENENLSYDERAWGEKLERLSTDSRYAVRIPWDELGMIPFDERVLGFAAFQYGANNRLQASLPTSAKREIPGTWGDISLEK